MKKVKKENGMRPVTEIYGENVFGLKTMRNYLSEKAYKSLRATIKEKRSLDPDIADEVADVMKNWAVALLGSLVRAIAIVPRSFFRPLLASLMIGSCVCFCSNWSVKPPPCTIKSGMTL